jgi:mRNA-degrading endonuclease RelE of RelBE toxin-antitoxin system
VSWRVFVRAAAEVDFEALDAPDQLVVSEELFRWVNDRPPRATLREVLGVRMFDDTVVGGFKVTYVVDEPEQNVLVLRIRKAPTLP